MDGLLLERPVESLGHAIGLRLGDEGEARRDAPELIEEVGLPVPVEVSRLIATTSG